MLLCEENPSFLMADKQILLVDDDKEVARLMRSYLEKAGYKVIVAYNGGTAMHLIRRERPDLLLLDLMLPDIDGWDITRTVREDPHLADIPIIMLTARISDTDKIVGLDLGADDYVTKPYNPREVVSRVRARLRIQGNQKGKSSQKIHRFREIELDENSRRVYIDKKEIYLTVTEFEILKALMEQSGYVLTRSDLIRKSLGSDFLGIERTLDSHVRNLRKKIEPDPKNPTYIQTIYGVRYKLKESDIQ
jgi:two-component system, OmpR family, alkaline phosphatase synthesis response regulator PhoP